MSDYYLKFIVEELKPYIDLHYSTSTDRLDTFIAGSYMGGLISMYAVCEYRHIIGGAACLSTHWIDTFDTLNIPIPSAFSNYLSHSLPKADHHKIYFDDRTEFLDALYETSQNRIDKVMREKWGESDNWDTVKFENHDHAENSWRSRLDIHFKFLLQK